MPREVFDVCDRCGFRKQVNPDDDNKPISLVRVIFFGGGTVDKDFCRNCRQALGEWISAKVAATHSKNNG